jgi:4-carboxymuconolactone decarboxylase
VNAIVGQKGAAKTAIDIDAREAEITGKPQRVAPLAPEEVTDEGKALYSSIFASFGATEKPGPIPEFYRMRFRNLDLFRVEMDMFMQLLTRGTLPPRDREFIILRVLWLASSPNPFGEHVELGKMVGLTAGEIERITQGSKASGWSEHEAAILAGVEELFERHAICDETWDILKRSWDDTQLIEFPLVVGQYISSALVHNALRTTLSPHNKGLRHR